MVERNEQDPAYWEAILAEEGLSEAMTVSEEDVLSDAALRGDALQAGDDFAAAERARLAAIEQQGDDTYRGM